MVISWIITRIMIPDTPHRTGACCTSRSCRSRPPPCHTPGTRARSGSEARGQWRRLSLSARAAWCRGWPPGTGPSLTSILLWQPEKSLTTHDKKEKEPFTWRGSNSFDVCGQGSGLASSNRLNHSWDTLCLLVAHTKSSFPFSLWILTYFYFFLSLVA